MEMPTIRIDDDVFAGLKSLAEPFVDTPNSVIRSLLEDRGVLRGHKVEVRTATVDEAPEVPGRATAKVSKSGALTPQPLYEQFLLYVLAEKSSGSASKNDATKRVIHLMKEHGFLNDVDFQRVSTGETKAENTIAWGRNALKERELIRNDSPKGVWELTEAGMREGKRIKLPRK